MVDYQFDITISMVLSLQGSWIWRDHTDMCGCDSILPTFKLYIVAELQWCRPVSLYEEQPQVYNCLF